ncbi:MAG: ParB/Srx family N-terminal domain-containing protein [Paracoccaceae bacterium]
MTDLHIEQIAVGDLRPWERNAHTRSRKQIRQIADRIETFGFTNPVLLYDGSPILADDGRVAAAKLLGMTEVPCVRLAHMTPAQKRACVLADKKLALNAGWHENQLGQKLGALTEMEDLDFDLEVTGFSIAEIDSLIDAVEPEKAGDPRDDAVPGADVPCHCRPGDIWQLGAHRLICGNALEAEVVALLMDGERACMAFTDPPINVPSDGHVDGKGNTKYREFATAVGEMSEKQSIDFLRTSFQTLSRTA